jgi:hypothetical protein
MDATDIIDAFGGYTALAKEIGLGRTAVYMWFSNGIPKARCLQLAKLATDRRIKVPIVEGGRRRRVSLTVELLLNSRPREATAQAMTAGRKKGTRTSAVSTSLNK